MRLARALSGTHGNLFAYSYVKFMELRRRIEIFLGPDEVRAKEAFNGLSPAICKFLNTYLRSILPKEVDRQDAISAALFRLWNYRSSLQFESEGTWWALIARTGRNCAFTLLGKPKEDELPTDFDQRSKARLDGASKAFEEEIDIYRLADARWLQIPLELRDAERRRRLLAAQLYYVDKLPWKEVCEIVGHHTPVDRRILDEWLSTKAVLLDLVYHRLYWDNERLTGYLLRPTEPLNSREIDSLAANPAAIQLEWSPDAVRVLIHRFRYGLIKEKVAQRLPDLDKGEIEECIQRATAQFPFATISRDLVSALRESLFLPEVFAVGLWKRLAFQYFALELPHLQILERTEPASSATGFHLTDKMLNGWLSNGRIFIELKKYWRRCKTNGGS